MNLTGVWYGRYGGTTDVAPNRFIALLTDDDAGALGGTISEPDDLGIDDIRRASVHGTRAGADVRFVKQYDGTVLAHAVQYDGRVDDEGTMIAGHWHFAAYAGAFIMERELPVEALADETIEAEEPV